MNEFQRQSYLSSLGIDSYMPRFNLPYAAESICRSVPEMVFVSEPSILSLESTSRLVTTDNETSCSSALRSLSVEQVDNSKQVEIRSPTKNLMADIFSQSKETSLKLVGKIDLQSLSEPNRSQVVEPFSLSVRRPLKGLMIIDSRDTRLALPTEFLLNNILRAIFGSQTIQSSEEVLHWPMINNSFTKRSELDARAELQTWLSVQSEIDRIDFLWLMGANASLYFLPEHIKRDDHLWQLQPMVHSNSTAIILPSLNELLLKPQMKKQLHAALRDYHFQNHE
jgi:hypothetical protein